jgi:hypothetical protein
MIDNIYYLAKQQINAPEQELIVVCDRILADINKIYSKSDRLQSVKNINSTLDNLIKLRINKLAEYYKLGAKKGYETLSSRFRQFILRGLAIAPNINIYDFIQSFHIEILRTFRREHQLIDHQPTSKLEIAEYLSYAERYAKRRIVATGKQLITMRMILWANKGTKDRVIDIEKAVAMEDKQDWEDYLTDPIAVALRSQLITKTDAIADLDHRSTTSKLVSELIKFLSEREQYDCIKYFKLRLQELEAHEINQQLGLQPKQRDYLQQRFKHHLGAFRKKYGWQLYHQWLNADVENNLGLTSSDWSRFTDGLTDQQRRIMELRKKESGEGAIARCLGMTKNQVAKQWELVLDKACLIRNA